MSDTFIFGIFFLVTIAVLAIFISYKVYRKKNKPLAKEQRLLAAFSLYLNVSAFKVSQSYIAFGYQIIIDDLNKQWSIGHSPLSSPDILKFDQLISYSQRVEGVNVYIDILIQIEETNIFSICFLDNNYSSTTKQVAAKSFIAFLQYIIDSNSLS
ncbi:hypothetical protein LJC56_03325 [Christensenellaceae bacterium OttesenSCG-928-K19]|nr:hypothetical protein [Christensenellaceae bacterium OttesenSCG-928-K19]